MILKDFSDTPFQEGLGKMSEDCVYDLNFDGSDDLLWFDLNYPLDRGGCQPMVVGIQVGGERIRLESYDVEKLYAFVLADLNLKDSRCDLIVSMRQASDGEEKTSVISISHHGKADFWHTESAYAEGQTASLFDGRFRGISPDGVIQIGEASFIPARGRILIRQ